MKKDYDVNFRLELEASVYIQAKSEKEAIEILNKKMNRIIEVDGREIEEIDVDTKVILVRKAAYES